MGSRDDRIDDYIARAQPFARPILKHIREIVHRACPEVEETMKWSLPHFDYKGMLCGVAAFKAHATFGFWKAKLLVAEGVPEGDESAMGQFGCLTSVRDLPGDLRLVRILKAAMALNGRGVKVERLKPPKKPPVGPPADLVRALKKNRKALATFQGFAPGHKREYVEWITEAKRPETRTRRIAQAVEWMADGKSQNWKYEERT